MAALVGYGWIGFMDDYAKVTNRRNLGLSGRGSWSISL
jgi:UDP-N-acetylmuramyl pentapeptide phosphotransferase/UDP-N-acetylglucosamine-1-phosphate transferase